MNLLSPVLLLLCFSSTSTAQGIGFTPNLLGGNGGGFRGLGQIFSQLGIGNLGSFQSLLQPNFGFSNSGSFKPFSGYNPFGGSADQGGQGQSQGVPQQQQPGAGFGQDPQQGQQQQPFGPQNQQQQQQQPFDQQNQQQPLGPQNQQQPFNPQNQQQQPFGPQNFQQPNSFGQSIQQIVDIFNPFNFNPSGGGNPQNLIPDLSNIISMCGSSVFFFDQNPVYRRAIRELKSQLLGISDAGKFAQTVSQLQGVQDLNRQVWLRASVGALLQRPDISSFRIPSLLEVNPGFVLQTEIVNSVQQQVQVPQQQRQCVMVDGNVGSDNGEENALWYFREDVMANSHHWFWHLTYPMSPLRKGDRSGELFYSMHHNLVGRYNAERLANGFNRVVPFFLDQIAYLAEGYNPHLTNLDASLPWTPRPAGTQLPQFMQTFTNISMDDALTNYGRLLQAVNQGVLLTAQGDALPLSTLYGTDSLGTTVEATTFSVNPGYYGALGHHNTGHVLIANVVNQNANQAPGIMAETSTSMRDVAFYRWHKGIDMLFQTYKDNVFPAYQPYGGDYPLAFPGVAITGLQVIGRASQTPNQLVTFWGTRNVNLGNGLDFFRNPQAGAVPLCVRHIDHEEFEYQIVVQKDPNVGPVRAAIRIFLAPRFDENGQRYTLQEQRTMFFVLDTFTIALQDGPNQIIRSSVDSTLTIGWPQSVQELNSDQNRTSVYCGCGWPRHMLLPRGTPQGMPFDLFVMVTNETDGEIPTVNQLSTDDRCEMAYLFCGIRNSRYPDVKPMGFPFDRAPYSIPTQGGGSRMVQSLGEFVSGLPNAATIPIQIVHQANN